MEEPGIGVYEPESGKHLSAEDFHQDYSPEEHQRYSAEDVAVKSMREKHWGPW